MKEEKGEKKKKKKFKKQHGVYEGNPTLARARLPRKKKDPDE